MSSSAPGSTAAPDVAAGGDLAELIAFIVRALRSTRDWTARIDEVLVETGRRLDVCRINMFEVHDIAGGGVGQTVRFDWAKEGLDRLTNDPRNAEEPINRDPLFVEWTARRRRGETIAAHTRDLTGRLRQIFERQQICSVLSVPIMVNDDLWGHIGLGDCQREREWTASERQVLESVAYLIGSAIELSGSSLVLSETSRLAMLRTALDAIIVIDEDSCVLEFNPAAEAMFQRSREDLLGTPLGQAIVPHRHRAAHDAGFKRYLKGGPAHVLGRRIETEGLRADGVEFPVELTITEIQVQRRRLFVAYLRDLTERKAAEAEAVRQRTALHQSEKMSALGSLLAGIAHELNNPLSVVVGRAVLLEEDCTDAAQRDQLRRLREAAERCARISQNFLKMARHNPIQRQPMSLNEACRSALDIIAYAARSGGVRVDLDLAADLPPAFADSDQIVQIVVNLMINAVQAMAPVEGPRVLTIRTALDPERGLIGVDVADSGPGIPDAVMPRIFEPFFTTKDVGIGTGIGLAISQAMAVAHDGSLTAANRDEGGAVFRLRLPLRDTVDEDDDAAHAAGSLYARPRDILVIDDEPEVALLIRDILRRAGHRVDIAESGAVGLSMIASKTYHTIFCDLKMPEIDGPAVRRRLLADHPAIADRLVFVTGDRLGHGIVSGLIEGCRVIEKPFKAAEILDAASGPS